MVLIYGSNEARSALVTALLWDVDPKKAEVKMDVQFLKHQKRNFCIFRDPSFLKHESSKHSPHYPKPPNLHSSSVESSYGKAS